MKRLVQLYEAIHDEEKAEAWRQQREAYRRSLKPKEKAA
jgi:hypothetical protein